MQQPTPPAPEAARPLDLALAFACILAVAILPAFFFARMETTREQVVSEDWRALTVARMLRQQVSSGGAAAPVAKAAAEVAPGVSLAFVQTAAGVDDLGIAKAADLVFLAPDGTPADPGKDTAGRVKEVAGRIKTAAAEGGADGLCRESPDGGPMICGVAYGEGAVTGVLAMRGRLDAPMGWTLALCLGFAAFLFGLARWKPVARFEVPAAATALVAGGVAAGLMAWAAWDVVGRVASQEAALATLAGTAAGALPVHAPAVGPGFIATLAILSAALAAGLVRPFARFMADLRGRPFIYAAIAPAMVGMVLLIFVPFFMGVYLAFLDNDRNFVGMANFWEILFPSDVSDTNFYFTLGVTVMWTALNVFFHVAIGLALALVLSDAKLRGKAVYRVLLIIPWAVPNYITALIWKWIFNTQFGPANAMLALVGMAPVDWLGRGFWTNFGANVVTNTWLGFPFMMIVSLGALQSIPADLYEAAQMDGAGRWQQFRNVTLPLLKPALFPAIILGTIWTFNCFNVVYLVSGGAPDNKTNILLTEAYRAFRVLKNYGLAAAYSLIIFFILAAYTAVTNRITKAAESVYE